MYSIHYTCASGVSPIASAAEVNAYRRSEGMFTALGCSGNRTPGPEMARTKNCRYKRVCTADAECGSLLSVWLSVYFQGHRAKPLTEIKRRKAAKSATYLTSPRSPRPRVDPESRCVCFGGLFLRTPSRTPYRTPSACANRAAYPDPPPVVPDPESIDARASYRERHRSRSSCALILLNGRGKWGVVNYSDDDVTFPSQARPWGTGSALWGS